MSVGSTSDAPPAQAAGGHRVTSAHHATRAAARADVSNSRNFPHIHGKTKPGMDDVPKDIVANYSLAQLLLISTTLYCQGCHDVARPESRTCAGRWLLFHELNTDCM